MIKLHMNSDQYVLTNTKKLYLYGRISLSKCLECKTLCDNKKQLDNKQWTKITQIWNVCDCYL